MSDIAIRADNLSKQYKIGFTRYRHDTLRDQLAESARSLFSRNGRFFRKKNLVWALEDVSFEVKSGEIIGVIGRNGAGKSTLLKILSRITEPTKGSARLHGRLGSLLEVGTGFHPELTGRENVYLNGAILGMRKAEIERRFDEIVGFAEIEKFIDTPVKRYSSGMYVRLAFAVAAYLNPDILLIDEVLSVGDLAFQRKCMDMMSGLRERSTTILLVSHNMFAIKSMCNRVLYLSQGRTSFDGPAEAAIQMYEKDSQSTPPGWGKAADGLELQRRISITGIEALDEHGRPRTIFDHGERMRVRLTFEASQEIKHPNFCVAFMRSDNVACCNYNTAMDGFTIPSISGKGSIELLTPPLKLVAELYTIHVLVWDASFQRRYCFQTGSTFHVRHELLSIEFGTFHEPGEWRWSPAAGGPPNITDPGANAS